MVVTTATDTGHSNTRVSHTVILQMPAATSSLARSWRSSLLTTQTYATTLMRQTFRNVFRRETCGALAARAAYDDTVEMTPAAAQSATLSRSGVAVDHPEAPSNFRKHRDATRQRL